ncbi:hypothetical protein QU896_11155, partial [Citrobacter freundii]|uniref:hypothetical protein n=1 Tax=Citrobacter freundii TaxID=546 RepID=UPI0038B7877D
GPDPRNFNQRVSLGRNDLLIRTFLSSTATGQSRNMLFEECDRHLKERLFRAAKIESFSRLLNSLQAEGDINAQELSKILTQKTAIINEQGNKIWLNLITRETSDPIFYSLEKK